MHVPALSAQVILLTVGGVMLLLMPKDHVREGRWTTAAKIRLLVALIFLVMAAWTQWH